MVVPSWSGVVSKTGSRGGRIGWVKPSCGWRVRERLGRRVGPLLLWTVGRWRSYHWEAHCSLERDGEGERDRGRGKEREMQGDIDAVCRASYSARHPVVEIYKVYVCVVR